MTIDTWRELSPNIRENEIMSRHTTFKTGGAADLFASVGSEKEIAELITLAENEGIPFTVMGNGSNMLVSDKGIRGLVIQIYKEMSDCEVSADEITAGAGILLSRLAEIAAQAGLSGLEAVSGIPGTLGGAIIMNAGAYGGEIKDVLESVTYIDLSGRTGNIDAKYCKFGYRTSIFSNGDMIVTGARMKLKRDDIGAIRERMADYRERRVTKQPLSYPSAGSTFKRPEGYFAGKLIQDSELMGASIGGAQVSEKHAGFIINKGGASSADIAALIELVRKRVFDRFGVLLEPEVKFVGEW